jgi:hypothetical protein
MLGTFRNPAGFDGAVGFDHARNETLWRDPGFCRRQ